MTTEKTKAKTTDQAPETAPNPSDPATQTKTTKAGTLGKSLPQNLPFAGRLVRYTSREQFIAAAHTGEAEYSPAIVARVLPTKGPDDNPFRADLMVIDPERDGGTYVVREVLPFDGTGPGYAPLDGPVAVSIDREALKSLVALCIEDYLGQRDKDDARYDEASIRELVADEVKKVLSQDKQKGGK